MQPFLNLAFRSVFARRRPEHRLLSPGLVFIGRKRLGFGETSAPA